ncbi:MAG: HAD-IA family hydrolase [Bacillota bacterium]|nr:HAD-IA family hydrolase [Bacillota bacterium]
MNKLVIFDFDGVVVNSLALQEEAFNNSYREIVGGTPPEFREFLKHSGEAIDKIMSKMNLPKEMISPYLDYLKNNWSCVKLYDEVISIIKKLNTNEVKCALFTGKDKDGTYDLLGKLKIDDLFDIIITSDDVVDAKPSPEGIIKILNKLSINREKAIMVGDSSNDIMSANRAEIRSVLVNWENENNLHDECDIAEFKAKSPELLYQIIKENLKLA